MPFPTLLLSRTLCENKGNVFESGWMFTSGLKLFVVADSLFFGHIILHIWSRYWSDPAKIYFIIMFEFCFKYEDGFKSNEYENNDVLWGENIFNKWIYCFNYITCLLIINFTTEKYWIRAKLNFFNEKDSIFMVWRVQYMGEHRLPYFYKSIR